METLHSEGESPFAVKEDAASDSAGTGDGPQYVECPIEGCGEPLLLQELDYHLELHSEESGHHLPEASVVPPEQPLEQDKQEKRATPSVPGRSRSHRDAERHRQPEDGSEATTRQAKAVSAWKRLLRMPDLSPAFINLPKRRHHDGAPGSHATRGKRLGVSNIRALVIQIRQLLNSPPEIPPREVRPRRAHARMAGDHVEETRPGRVSR